MRNTAIYSWQLPYAQLAFAIVGFRMMSLKFKLKNYPSYRDFYFHDALEQLKTNCHTNFCYKRVLGFVIEYA